MNNKLVTKVLLVIVLFHLKLLAYDVDLADRFDKVFSKYTLKGLNDSKILIDADSIIKMLQNKENFILLDIRTQEEIDILGFNSKNHIDISLDLLFKKENLDRLPTDKPIIVVCHSGSRALQVVTSLEVLGFKNAKVLYGGIIALAKSNSTKNIFK